jgi:hypothetical protein
MTPANDTTRQIAKNNLDGWLHASRASKQGRNNPRSVYQGSVTKQQHPHLTSLEFYLVKQGHSTLLTDTRLVDSCHKAGFNMETHD